MGWRSAIPGFSGYHAAKFGVEGVPVLLKPGVQVQGKLISDKFAPAAFNPEHAKLISFRTCRNRSRSPSLVIVSISASVGSATSSFF